MGSSQDGDPRPENISNDRRRLALQRPENLRTIDLLKPAVEPRLLIEVRGGVGYGPTTLAAFDDALHSANVANFNLIQLSSMIPEQARVVVLDRPQTRRLEGSWDDRLYVVMAKKSSNTEGETVAAGLGWVQDRITGRGLFVEHQDNDIEKVRHDIDVTLGAMMQSRSHEFGPIQHRMVAETTPADAAACALVVATFESQPWIGSDHPTSMLN